MEDKDSRCSQPEQRRQHGYIGNDRHEDPGQKDNPSANEESGPIRKGTLVHLFHESMMPQEPVDCSVDSVQEAFSRNLTRLLPEDAPRQGALLAVSGGADSTALVLLCASVIPDLLREVSLAHFHHHLRGVEADEDEQFVWNLAEKLGFKYHRGDWTPESRESLPRADRNLQAAARKARYEFLGRTAQSLGYSLVLTAHHRRDQVETVLQNLARGGGSGAWHGIRESLFRDGVTVLRPLLPFPPERLRDFLEAKGQPFRQDSSNADPKYRRNWVRHELLPNLYEAYPDFEECVVQICRKYEEREEYWRRKAEEVKERGLIREDSIVLSRQDLVQIPEEGRFFCIREILRGLASPAEASGWAPTRRKPLDAFFMLLDTGGDGEVNLPGGIHARSAGNAVILQKPEGLQRDGGSDIRNSP